jgi:hypothetical protein
MSALCNQALHTDREITASRPDIIIKNKNEKTCTLTDVATPADRNVVQMEWKICYKSRVWVQRYSECGTWNV